MFFKATVLKRMLKAAYKGAGLIVGHSAAGEDGGGAGRPLYFFRVVGDLVRI